MICIHIIKKNKEEIKIQNIHNVCYIEGMMIITSDKENISLHLSEIDIYSLYDNNIYRVYK